MSASKMDHRLILDSVRSRLQGVRRCAGYDVACCPAHDDMKQSLSYRLADNGRVLFHCFAGCSYKQITAALGGGFFRQFRSFYQVSTPAPASADASKHQRIERARLLWRNSPSSAGSPVEKYLRSRAITIAIPPTIRFRQLKHPTGAILPAMVAAVVTEADGIVAIHRTFLDWEGRKTKLDPVKAALGPIAGGAVRFASAGSTLVLCEGIETALSVLQATGLPTWAALGTSNLPHVELPDIVREVIIAADGDEPGERAARQSAQRFLSEGRRVRIARPAQPGNDFNDVLRGSG
jgi:putative DNA primase/helicase